jgi:hypothetical protein
MDRGTRDDGCVVGGVMNSVSRPLAGVFAALLILSGGACSSSSDEVDNATVVVNLTKSQRFIEGFNFGVRVERDGEVIAEKTLNDFDVVAEGSKDWRGPGPSYRATFDVPPGEILLVSDLRTYAWEEPDFGHNACELELAVASAEVASVELDWGDIDHVPSYCLRPE